MLRPFDMQSGYIEYISAYCDRWCERCAFTSRCSTFAAEAAIAMCGDVAGGLELAVGLPARVPFGPARPARADCPDCLDGEGPSAPDVAAAERHEAQRRGRVDRHPVVTAAWAVSMLACQWLKGHADPLRRVADPVVGEALAVAGHDAFLVTVKLTRAVGGRDAHERGERRGDGPVQNDWNGSAKVALVCLERSREAWLVIAQASGDDAACEIAGRMDALRRDVEATFPAARAFVRPGFDERGA